MDIHHGLVEQARERLAAIGYRPTLGTADGLAGYAPRAPYDRIIGTCSTARVPAPWLAQTKTGGVVVANVGHGVVPLRVGENGSASGRFLPGPVAFIEARPADGSVMSIDDAIDLVYGDGDTVVTGPLDGVDDQEFWFVVNVVMPGHVWFELQEGGRARCLVDRSPGPGTGQPRQATG